MQYAVWFVKQMYDILDNGNPAPFSAKMIIYANILL